MLKRMMVAFALLAGLSGAVVIASAAGATPASACEAHTS